MTLTLSVVTRVTGTGVSVPLLQRTSTSLAAENMELREIPARRCFDEFDVKKW